MADDNKLAKQVDRLGERLDRIEARLGTAGGGTESGYDGGSDGGAGGRGQHGARLRRAPGP